MPYLIIGYPTHVLDGQTRRWCDALVSAPTLGVADECNHRDSLAEGRM